MPMLRKTIAVDRPPEEVFDYLTRVEHHREWSPKAWRVEGRPGPLTGGARFTSYGRIPGDKDHCNEVEVTECTPPSRIAWAATEKEGRFVSTFVLTPDGSGTKVQRTFEYPHPRGFIRAIFPLISATIVKPNFNKGLDMLQQRLEGGNGRKP